MSTKILTVFALFLSLGTTAMADEEMPAEPVVRSSEYGQTYVRSVPDEPDGQKGKTRVFSVGRDSDELLCEYDWYAAEIYIGGPGGETLVRFGPWHRGHQPQEDHLAIGIYRGSKTIREYSTLDMQKLGSGYSPSVSHYVVFQRRIGFRWTGGNSYVYEVEGVSGKVFAFDIDTGAVEEKAAAQSAGGGAKAKVRVPDEETAVAIAVAVWSPIYGKEQIEKEKPYQAALKDGIWHVSGSLPEGWKGGVAEAEIAQEDGRILSISHGE